MAAPGNRRAPILGLSDTVGDADVTPDLLDPLQGLVGFHRQRAVTSFSTPTRRRDGSVTGIASLHPAHVRTFQVVSPRQTHTRPATCAEAGCEAWRGGFNVVCPNTPEGRAWAHRVRTECRPVDAVLSPAVAARIRRRYTLTADPSGALTFTFDPGTPCFTAHRVELDRPELYVVRGGDLRGNPRQTPTRRHTTAGLWVEEFAGHQDQLKTAHERG